MYRCFLKRLIGFWGALVALLLLSPLFIFVMVWLHFANRGAGVLYIHPRPGRGGKIFNCLKFKSMTDERDENGILLPDKDRLTSVGRFIRKTSIDELPQLINILKGDMAFIGPRPLPVTYLPYYTEEEFHRHDVRPGITGWAQVNGRTALDWPDRIRYDLDYVNHLTLWMDVKIFFLTVYKVFKHENVGLDKSGKYSFFNYRDAQWAAEGRYDLIEEAYYKSGRKKPNQYLKK